MLGALHELLRGLHSADRARIEALAAGRPEHLYEGLLTVLLRLVSGGLVRAGLATMTTETIKAGGRPIAVTRVRITDAGRKAIEG